jgi:hypothetical protein
MIAHCECLNQLLTRNIGASTKEWAGKILVIVKTSKVFSGDEI